MKINIEYTETHTYDGVLEVADGLNEAELHREVMRQMALASYIMDKKERRLDLTRRLVRFKPVVVDKPAVQTKQWYQLVPGDRFSFDTHPNEVFTVTFRLDHTAYTVGALRYKCTPDDPELPLAKTIENNTHCERGTTVVIIR